MLHRRAIIICGPTATGKTSLAIAVARLFHGELVNADSRQIIRGYTIVTGKDIPSGAEPVMHGEIAIRGERYALVTYDMGGAVMWLYDAVGQGIDMSVSHYRVLATHVIDDILERGKTPVIVGGTGFYIGTLVHSPETIDIPRNVSLRDELEAYPVSALQRRTETDDPERWMRMNDSDRNNPRRLIRAIEIAAWNHSHDRAPSQGEVVDDPLLIGIEPDWDSYREVLRIRVDERLEGGALQEVAANSDSDVSVHQKTILGVPILRRVLSGDITIGTARDLWISAELRYAKRQMTWFKKQPNIRWFRGSDRQHLQNIEKAIRQWYTI